MNAVKGPIGNFPVAHARITKRNVPCGRYPSHPVKLRGLPPISLSCKIEGSKPLWGNSQSAPWSFSLIEEGEDRNGI